MIVFEIAKLLQQKKNMNMADFSELLGVEPQTVYNWNQGRAVPRIPMLLIIIKLLDVSWAELGDYLVLRPGLKL